MKTVAAVLLLLLPVTASAIEKAYQDKWCAEMNGQTEVVLPDRARVDCVTKDYAVEIEFAHKWAESIGQSLYYGIALKKKPGVVLIVAPWGDEKYVARFKAVAKKHKIRLWEVKE